jgi:predicted anti-sigma-YlaC factor YlaD
MKTVNCEAVRMASSAASDGYHGPLESAQIEDHLAQCGDCRSELERLGELMRLLDSLNRREFNEQLWRGIETRLALQAPVGRVSRDLKLLVPISVVLLAYKLFEQLAVRNIGFQIKLVLLLLVILLFAVLKENPFKINAELQVKVVEE